jgi:gliding motility-associated-like protein
LQATNAFDVSSLGVGEYTYTLENDGCTDDFKLYIIEPSVEVNQQLDFCLIDQQYSVLDYVTIFPDWGNISGPGILDSNDIWYFNPMDLGPGRHLMHFEAVGCSDSFYIDVEAPADIPPYAFCEFDAPSVLQADPAGGNWWGPGILDGSTGLFDPKVPGVGFHEIFYRSPRGCITADTIEVFLFEQVGIDGVDQQYCFSDTVINIVVSPSGGELYVNGVLSTGTFNPSLLGTGNHEIYYSKGSGACQSDDKLFFSVLPPISGNIQASNDSICLGQNTVVEVRTEGGVGNLTAVWSGSLGFGDSHIVTPTSSTWYYVSVDDGCSVSYYDSVFVYVYPEFAADLIEGPEVCYGDSTWVEVSTPNQTDYEVVWQTSPEITGFRYDGLPGFYSVRINELFSGCFEELTVVLPGAAPLKANFSITPNQDCIDIINNEIDIIDLAVGYSDGWMTFGDGADTVSLLNGIISHAYDEIGDFKITQFVTNELGCTDTLTRWICVKNKVVHYFPNIFTPNGDGDNDEYKIFIKGVTELEWTIFNRWGEMMFRGDSVDDAWDGTFDGQIVTPGVFVLKVSFKDAETGFPQVLTKSLTMIK